MTSALSVFAVIIAVLVTDVIGPQDMVMCRMHPGSKKSRGKQTSFAFFQLSQSFFALILFGS